MIARPFVALLMALPLWPLAPKGGYAQDFWESSYLLNLYRGSHRSSVAADLRMGGFDLSGGEYIAFRDWYTPALPDLTLLFLSQISDNFGMIWGVSSGERGPKYHIEPAIHLGFVYQYVPADNAVFAIKAVYPLFGRMHEKTCLADYGAIGGIQNVNCRLAADPMQPEDTLDYLIDLRGEVDATLGITFTLTF